MPADPELLAILRIAAAGRPMNAVLLATSIELADAHALMVRSFTEAARQRDRLVH